MKEGQRNYSIELLKIIAFVFITSLHYMGWGGILVKDNIEYSNINFLLAYGINACAQCGTAIFFMITGYFMKPTEFKFKKLFELEKKTIFYSLIITIIVMVFGIEKFSIPLLIERAFPVLTNHYWFITVYVILLFFLPLIAEIKIKDAKYHLLTIICFGLYFLLYNKNVQTLSYAILCCLIGSYLSRLDLSKIKPHFSVFILLFFIFSLLSAGYTAGIRLNLVQKIFGYAIFGKISIPTLLNILSGTSLFLAFLKIKLKNNNNILLKVTPPLEKFTCNIFDNLQSQF